MLHDAGCVLQTAWHVLMANLQASISLTSSGYLATPHGEYQQSCTSHRHRRAKRTRCALRHRDLQRRSTGPDQGETDPRPTPGVWHGTRRTKRCTVHNLGYRRTGAWLAVATVPAADVRSVTVFVALVK